MSMGQNRVDILICGGIVVTMDPERTVFENGAVAIQGNRIVEVGRETDLVQKYQHDTLIDGHDKLVMPGLVDCHVHFYEYNRGFIPDDIVSREWVRDYAWPLASVATPDDEYWYALNLMAAMIRTGTTAFLECGTLWPERTVKAAAEAGMRATIGRWCWDQLGWGKVAPPLQTIDEALRLTKDLIREWHGAEDGRIRIFATSEGVSTASDALWIGLKELADQYGTGWQTHTATSRELVQMLVETTGHRDVEHLAVLGVLDSNVVLNHVVDVSDEEVDMLKEHQVRVVMNPGSAIRQVKGITQIGKFPHMLREGITIGIGCDSVNSSFTHDMVRAMQLAVGLIRDQSMDPAIATSETAVELATLGGAKVLGLEDEIGSLEAGKRADVILFDTDRPEWLPLYNPIHNLVWSASGDSVDTVIVDGKILMEKRELKTIDEERVIAEVQACRAGVIERAKPYVSLHQRWKVVR
ncbi:MAG: amidohydrolase [Ardenticatenaceae bacterium]|nr:amidohydrolase [Ardenticatenaceae bacterium]